MALIHSFLAIPFELPKFLSDQITSKKEDKKLSYQSLRCVLEYLEANRRIHIAARCPFLQNIERTVPLNINNLQLGQSKVTLNRVDYVFQQLKRELNSVGPRIYSYDGINYVPYRKTFDRYGLRTPGDILIKGKNGTEEEVLANHFRLNDLPNPLQRFNISFKFGSEEVSHRLLPESLVFHVAMKKLTTYLFGRRRDIKVRSLKIITDRIEILRLPIGLQLHVHELCAVFESITSLRPIIKEQSFPLKRLSTVGNVESSLNDPIIQTAKTLVLSHISLRNLLKMPNQVIILSRAGFSGREIVEIVKHSLNSGRRTCYIFGFEKWRTISSLSKVLELIREQDMREVTEKWIKSKNIEPQLKSVSFPMSATSTLKISANEAYHEKLHFFRIEVVPIVVVLEPIQKQVESRISKFLSIFFGCFVV